MITIEKREDNRKNKYISLTKQRKEVYTAHHSLHEKLYHSISESLSSFSNDQIQTIKYILEKVGVTIKQYRDNLTEKEEKR